MADKYKIAKSWMKIWVRSGPGTKYSTKGVIDGKDGKTYTVTERKNKYWLKIPSLNGWCCERDSDGTIVLKMTEKGTVKEGLDAEDNSSTTSTVNPNKNQNNTGNDNNGSGNGNGNGNNNGNNNGEESEESYAYVPDKDYEVIVLGSNDDSNGIGGTAVETTYKDSLENNFTISNLHGIFGMPYQFMADADPRVTNAVDGIGRKYAKELVSNMPLLLIRPGKPVFMAKYTKDDKKNILKKFLNFASGKEDDIRNTILSDKGFGKYYSLEYAENEYFQYVNPMCRIAARIMGLHNTRINGIKLDSYSWAKSTNDNIAKIFSVYRGCTAWYCESENNVTDSFSNGTTESMLASKVNSLSDYGREINFLLGTVKSGTGVALDKFTNAEGLNDNMEVVENMINTALGNNGISGIFKSITSSAQTVMAGGKLVFPEIWSESSFSRSYSINLKLVSPDGDDLSIYLNIIVPMLHLLGLVLPRQAADTEYGFAYGYISPFLVRAFYKGYFNVDMGIITDLSFSKGKDSAWTSSGVPTTVDVSLTIKDLYNDMYMTNMDGIKNNMMKNIILMDYIANMCGVNINEVDVIRGIDLFFTMNVKNRIVDTWRMKIFGNMDQWVSNKVQAVFGKF